MVRKRQQAISRVKLNQIQAASRSQSLGRKVIAKKVINRTQINRIEISLTREIANHKMAITSRVVKGNAVSREKRATLTEQVMVIAQIMAVALEMAATLVRTNQKEAVTEIRVDNVNSH